MKFGEGGKTKTVDSTGSLDKIKLDAVLRIDSKGDLNVSRISVNRPGVFMMFWEVWNRPRCGGGEDDADSGPRNDEVKPVDGDSTGPLDKIKLDAVVRIDELKDPLNVIRPGAIMIFLETGSRPRCSGGEDGNRP